MNRFCGLPLTCIAVVLSACEGKKKDVVAKDYTAEFRELHQHLEHVEAEISKEAPARPFYEIFAANPRAHVGDIHDSPPPRIGESIVWGDDVYKVEDVRYAALLHTETTKGSRTFRRATVQVLVKFIGKRTAD